MISSFSEGSLVSGRTNSSSSTGIAGFVVSIGNLCLDVSGDRRGMSG